MNIRDELIEHIPRLRRYARALIHNRELADDLVQDTLERALGRTGQFRLGTDMRAWLFTIMHNLFVNQVRKSSARGAHVSVDNESVPETEYAISASQLVTLEVRDLDYALQRLPAKQREVLLLVSLEETSHAEVALALGIPIGTVMSRLSRARATPDIHEPERPPNTATRVGVSLSPNPPMRCGYSCALSGV